MPLNLRGYLLEPPRVGQANSPFTFTPNNVVQSVTAFEGYYTPGAEDVSRTEYLVLVQSDGSLVNQAAFGWTKNDGGNFTGALVRRFDYDAQAGSFRPLPGSTPEIAGQLGPDSNTTRLKVSAPIGFLAEAPYRLSVGSGSGVTFTVTLVATDGAFTSPPSGTVELSLATGNLHWASADLLTYAGQDVRWQRQSFFDFTASTGRLGRASQDLLLNPIPGPGQYPMVRFGFGLHLTPLEVPDEASFSPDPLAGVVEWARTTGRLKFNAGDLAVNLGRPVYYDGVLFSWREKLLVQAGGTVNAPLPLLPVPVEGGDIIFSLPTGYQFPTVRRVTTFDDGTAGEVQLRMDGAVQFSVSDQATYHGSTVYVTVADLAIERGVVLRFFRSPVNLDGQDPTVKDVTSIYTVTEAVWASPVVQVPFVFLPATPIEGPGYPLSVYVEQGTGSFTGLLPDLNVPSPPVGLGYVLDYETRQFYYAQRKVNQRVTFPQASAALQLPDVAVREEQLEVSVETAPGTGIFTPLVFGVSALFDKGTGLVTLMAPHGTLLVSGSGSMTGNQFTDPAKNFVTSGVLPGHTLVLSSGPAAGVYTITAVAATQLTTDVAATVNGTASYEVRTPGEVLADRYFVPTVPIDPNTKVERVRLLGPIQNAQTVFTGVLPGQLTTAFTLVDTSVDFGVLGVQPGDTVKLLTGPDTGSHRTITIVEPQTLTVDRAFTSFPSALYAIERRLHLPRPSLSRTRVRLGQTFVTPTPVATNSAFTAPALLPAEQVEVSQETGDLNFSLVNVTAGGNVFSGLTLRFPVDFRVSKDLGFIELNERLLTNDEVFVTYRPITSEGVQPAVTERVGFLIRKELTQPWPRPAVTNIVTFNPAGRTVAPVPPPAVYRGGRPQDSSQIHLNTAESTILFQPKLGFTTNALPSGSALDPEERVLVDYYVYEAVGGERSFSTLHPIYAAQIILQGGSSSFSLVGDQTSLFPVGYLLRVDRQQVYLIGAVFYNAPNDQTTITLAYGAVFQDDFTNPKLEVSSGAIPLTPVFLQPSYFRLEMAPFAEVPRGTNTFSLPGDASLTYGTGTVVLFTDNATYFDLYLVSGAKFKEGVTEIVLQQNVRRQYGTGTVLKRSVRPILEEGVTQIMTRDTPILGQGYTLYRRVEGQPGVVMIAPTDYTLDASGVIRYSSPLGLHETLVLFYTSYRVVPAGTQLLASYTSLVAPDDQNGLSGQVLRADYSILSGDSFFYRVETLTNFSGEILQDLQEAATRNSPSGGPTTSNAASPALFEQGRESLFFVEGHTANVDRVARRYLKFFNDAVHHLEDVLQDADGRVVGDRNGRFRFDGLTTNPVRTAYAQVTNEIDDRFKVSDFPTTVVSISPLVTVSVGTYLPLYQPSAFSRFYPTAKAHLFALITNGTPTAQNGEIIGDLGQKALTTLPSVAYRRLPRAYITQEALAGATTLFVDNASGTPAFLRPPFAVGMAVVISDQDGTVLVSDAAPLLVTAVLTSPERIQVSPLPTNIPAGATVFLCVTGATPDTTYAKNYRLGFDVAVDRNEGQLVYVAPYPPFDGSVPLVPAPLQVQPPAAGEVLELDGVGLLQLQTTPFRFPALDGQVASDCGDQSIPILSPTPNQEIAANQQEGAAVSAALGSTTPPVVLGGVTLDGTGTLLTYTGPWPAPGPQLYDLVKFETGLNAFFGYRRISAVGVSTVQVDTAFPFPGVGGDIVLTSTVDVATGTATFPTSTTLQDLLLSPAILPGHTIVVTSGGNQGVRRQVVARLSPTTLQLDAALPTLIGGTYRVSDHLRTFSGWDAALEAANRQAEVTLTNDHGLNPLVVDSVVLAIDRFFEGQVGMDGVLTDLLAPPSNVGSVAGVVLTDASQDFAAAGVNATHFVFIQAGANAGFYPIQTVDSATQITTTLPFPSAGVVSYRVVKAFGVGFQALKDLFTLRAEAGDWGTSSQVWATTLGSTVLVVATPFDPNVYANGLMPSDLLARLAALGVRFSTLTGTTTGTVPRVEAIVKTRDKLYDKRFAWIDARVNVQTGSLYVIQRAVANRIEATTRLYNDLLKILSVQEI